MRWRRGPATRSDQDVLLTALGLATISGLRSSSGPAFLSHAASKGLVELGDTPFFFLGSPRVAAALKVVMVGELVGDKLPVTPSRTGLGPLVGRALSGALVGASLFASSGHRAAAGGILGALAATIAAPVGERSRAWIVSRTGTPDLVCAVLEDAVVLYTGVRLLRGSTSG